MTTSSARPPRWFARILPLALLVWLSPDSAQAYIDPAAGSLFLQLLLGGLAGLLVLLKMFWRKLTGLFRPKAPDRRAGT